MAGRSKGYRHNENTRGKIQAAQIINRLQRFVNGEIDMSPAQVNAANILLRKVIPDLSAVEHSGEVETNYVVRVPDKAENVDTWQNRFALPGNRSLVLNQH